MWFVWVGGGGAPPPTGKSLRCKNCENRTFYWTLPYLPCFAVDNYENASKKPSGVL